MNKLKKNLKILLASFTINKFTLISKKKLKKSVCKESFSSCKNIYGCYLLIYKLVNI